MAAFQLYTRCFASRLAEIKRRFDEWLHMLIDDAISFQRAAACSPIDDCRLRGPCAIMKADDTYDAMPINMARRCHVSKLRKARCAISAARRAVSTGKAFIKARKMACRDRGVRLLHYVDALSAWPRHAAI